MKKIIIFLMNWILYFSIIFFSNFLRIRIGRIYTLRVGHICYNLDYFLNKNIKKGEFNIFLFGTDEFISNYKLLELFKRSGKLIFFSRYFFYFYSFLKEIRADKKLIIEYQPDLHPDFSLVSKSQSLIKFNKKENTKGQNFITRNNLSGNYVIFHNRDQVYDKFILNDENFHDYRNFDFKDYGKTLDYCNQKNIKTVKFDLLNDEKNSFFFDGLIRLKEKKEFSELDQLYLIDKSYFVVGCNSGFLNLATVFRKPTIMINSIPFDFKSFDARSVGTIILPKKILDKKTKKKLTFFDMSNLEIDIHYKGDFFYDNDLSYENNSQEEILDVFKEMILKLNDKKEYIKKYLETKNKIDNIFKKNKYYSKFTNDLDINISYSFIEKNKYLI